MATKDRHTLQKQHWENIFNAKDHDKVSWFRLDAGVSFQLISQTARTNNNKSLSIMDIGAGANPVLIEQCLKELKQVDITVLDISQCALDKMRQNLTDLKTELNTLLAMCVILSCFLN